MLEGLNEVLRVYENLLKFIQHGEDSLTKAEIVELAEVSQLSSFIELTEFLVKSENQSVGDTMKKPPGPPGSQKNKASDASMKPGALPGLASPSAALTAPAKPKKQNVVPDNALPLAPGQTPPEGSKVVEGPKGGEYYIPSSSKAGDFADPDESDTYKNTNVHPHVSTAPSAVDESGRSIAVDEEASTGISKTKPIPPSPEEVKTVVKRGSKASPAARPSVSLVVRSYEDKVKRDLSVGEIEKIAPLSSSGASDCLKIKIKDDGEGLLKPPMHHLTFLAPDANGNKVFARKDMYADDYQGVGAGQISQGTTPAREEAVHLLAALHGMPSLVAPTVLRSHNGEVHSVQQWKDGYTSVCAISDSINRGMSKDNRKPLRVKDCIKLILQHAPTKPESELVSELSDLAAFNVIVNDADAHLVNTLIGKDGSLLKIDGSVTFCTGMSGSRNSVLSMLSTSGRKAVPSKRLITQLKNKSFLDYKRSMPNLQEWEAGQTFLRNRYVVHLTEKEGHLDPDKFAETRSNNSGTQDERGDFGWNGDEFTATNNYLIRKNKGLLPNQMFESWAKAYLEQGAADPAHTDHEDCKHLLELGVFMEQGYTSDPDYRKSGKHKIYQDSIKASLNVPVSIDIAAKASKRYTDEDTDESVPSVFNAATAVGG